LNSAGFGVGRTGHAGQLVVHAEVVLEGDGGQGLVFVFDADVFLGLQGLVQAVAVAPARHEAAGELVHDDDLALFDDVVHVALEHGVGLEGLVDMVQQLDVGRVVDIFGLQQLLGSGHALFGEGHALGLFVLGVMVLVL
jgi:hypothetical protein